MKLDVFILVWNIGIVLFVSESPIVVTLPHFYDADPSFLEAVDGLRPDSKKHQIMILFEPV